jgi:hypothetical protein
MPATWTPQQVEALAPDPGSAKSGRALAQPRQWVTLGHSEAAAWGECQGSGQKPYQTQVDLSGPAFRCTCPSRKFPCKHGLGLLFLLTGQPAAFTHDEPPAWVADWLASRAQRTEQQAKKPERAAAVADPNAQAKRAAQREARVAAGLEYVETWLRDLARGGLAGVPAQPYRFWETPAARMVDAQAPGVARMIREMAGVSATGEGWQERLLERLGKLYLLIEGFRRLEALPAETQADLRTLVGWAQGQEELLASVPEGAGVRDAWRVVGQRVEEQERLKVQRTWLWGVETRRAALLLQFAAPGQTLGATLAPGTEVMAELVFFPGAYPLRALVRERAEASTPFAPASGYATVDAAMDAYSAALACNLWLEEFPVLLDAAIPVRRGDRWAVRDAAGDLLPVAPRFESGWRLLALSGGAPVPLFGEWDGDALTPLGVWAEGGFHPLLASEAGRG